MLEISLIERQGDVIIPSRAVRAGNYADTRWGACVSKERAGDGIRVGGRRTYRSRRMPGGNRRAGGTIASA